jgi:hypothetical protein
MKIRRFNYKFFNFDIKSKNVVSISLIVMMVFFISQKRLFSQERINRQKISFDKKSDTLFSCSLKIHYCS